MSILFYCSEIQGTGKQIQRIIEKQVSGIKIQVYKTIKSFFGRLSKPTHDLTVTIIVAASHKELDELLLLGNLLQDIPIILILPDQKHKTIRKGHKLYPRFVSYLDSDFYDVALVLAKMVNRSKIEKKIAEKGGDKQQYTQTAPV